MQHNIKFRVFGERLFVSSRNWGASRADGGMWQQWGGEYQRRGGGRGISRVMSTVEGSLTSVNCSEDLQIRCKYL